MLLVICNRHTSTLLLIVLSLTTHVLERNYFPSVDDDVKWLNFGFQLIQIVLAAYENRREDTLIILLQHGAQYDNCSRFLYRICIHHCLIGRILTRKERDILGQHFME